MSKYKGIRVENEDFIAISSGNFVMGIGNCYILDKKGNLRQQYSLAEKPTEQVLKRILDNFTKVNKK